QTWQTISPDLTRNVASTEAPSGGPVDLDQSGAEIYPGVSALAVSPLDGQVIWAGSSDGLIHVTSDGGAHWQAVRPSKLPKWANITSIEPSHTVKGTAYLTASRYMWDDFAPYVYEATDYGKHWKRIVNGLPNDQYVFHVEQDPNDADLLFLGTKNTVYASFNGGAHWQPLTLNLPTVQVRDVAINTREGSVVLATHGRAFWVLNNLALLEQMTKHPNVAANDAALFAPEQAWLTFAYGRPDYPGAGKGAGENPPFGATVFFHVPADYDGKTPVTLTFSDAQGQTIRSFDLHLEQKKEENGEESENGMIPQQKKAVADLKATAIEPGMNRFQWDLRYGDATGVKGFYAPDAAGGLAVSMQGPEVVPGSYRVTLDYGGKKSVQSFNVALDPRINSSQGELAERFALQMKIHAALDTLDETINRAIAARDKLQAAIGNHKPDAAHAKMLTDLNNAINGVVQMNIQSSEGDLLHETKLHSHLAYLLTGVGMAYVQPTAAQYAVWHQLEQEAKAGEQKLESATTVANNRM
ncbi:MAG: WD40/YVTN/BNR-like repeat-containing protein, partial [Gammaproteobacteria bacterium]